MIAKLRASGLVANRYVVDIFLAPGPEKTFQLAGQLSLSRSEYNEVVAALRSRLTVIEETYGGEGEGRGG